MKFRPHFQVLAVASLQSFYLFRGQRLRLLLWQCCRLLVVFLCRSNDFYCVFFSALISELLMLVSDCVCVTLASRSVNALISSADVSGAEWWKLRLVRRGRQSSLSYKLWVQQQRVVLMNPSYLRWTIINPVYVPNNLYLIYFSKQFVFVHFPGLMLLSKLQSYAFYSHH